MLHTHTPMHVCARAHTRKNYVENTDSFQLRTKIDIIVTHSFPKFQIIKWGREKKEKYFKAFIMLISIETVLLLAE